MLQASSGLRASASYARAGFIASPWFTVKLRGDIPRMSAEAKRRLDALLDDKECFCGSALCSLTKRKVGASVVVHLQCEICGRGVGSAQPRQEHWHWQSYPEFDAGRYDVWSSEDAKRRAASLSAWRDERKNTLAERRRAYGEWLRTAPEWREMSAKVLRRSSGWCEACLSARADQVHHLTYDLGKLPPAWLLRAVCLSCHERLHADIHGMEDEWCPGSVIEQPRAAE